MSACCLGLRTTGVVELAELTLTLANKAEEIFSQLDGLFLRVRLENCEAAHYLFILGEGTVG